MKKIKLPLKILLGVLALLLLVILGDVKGSQCNFQAK